MPYVHPTVPNADELADLLGTAGPEGPINTIQIERSATGGGAGYSNIGTKTLVTGTLRYTYFDKDGAPTDWYRWYPSNAGNSFPTSGNRTYSDEVQPSIIEPGICDLGDVKQLCGVPAESTGSDELISSIIVGVSSGIMNYTGRRFVRTPQSGTQSFLFDVVRPSRTLWIPAGIAAMTTLEIATQTGGSFTTVATTDWFLDPPDQDRDYGWPATRVTLSDLGSVPYFYAGKRVVRTTMALGFGSIPTDIRGVAERASARRFVSRGQNGPSVVTGPSGMDIILPDMSGADRAILDFYRVRWVG